MTTFVYKARSRTGEIEEGDMEAVSRIDAAQKLMQRGFIPSKLEEKTVAFDFSIVLDIQEKFEKIKIEDLILFTSQMATLFNAGIPLVACFEGLIDQAEKQKMKRVLREVKAKVEEGTSMNEAMRDYPEIFSETFVNMIMAGEMSGTLDESLKRLTEMLENQFETQKRLKEVTQYPKIIGTVVVGAVVFLLSYVVPRFMGIFEKAKLELPMPTKILIFINNSFHAYWYVGIGIAVGGYILFKQYINTSIGRYQWHKYILKVPVIGEIMSRIAWSQFCMVLANMIKSGVPILEAMGVAGKAAGNDYLLTIFHDVEESVREGSGMAEPLKRNKDVPAIVPQMIAAGETSGALDEMLVKVADYFSKEASRKIKQLSSLVEPIMIFLLGGIVLFVALAIFLPMWDMTKLAH